MSAPSMPGRSRWVKTQQGWEYGQPFSRPATVPSRSRTQRYVVAPIAIAPTFLMKSS